MTYIIVLLVLLAIIALYIRNQKSRTGTHTEAIGSGPLPYMKKDYLLTKAERAFYDVLMIALAGRYNVFAKVRMLDLFYLPKGTKNRMGWNLLHVRAAISYDPQAIKLMIGIPA